MAKSIERYLRMMPKASGLRCSENFWYPAADVYKARGGKHSNTIYHSRFTIY